MTSKLYILTLLAVRANVSGARVTGEAGASTVLTVQTSYEAAEAEGWNDVHKKYPHTL